MNIKCEHPILKSQKFGSYSNNHNIVIHIHIQYVSILLCTRSYTTGRPVPVVPQGYEVRIKHIFKLRIIIPLPSLVWLALLCDALLKTRVWSHSHYKFVQHYQTLYSITDN